MPKYFNFTEIKELGDAEVQQLISNRATIFCVQPHGVFSFGGASAGVTWAKNWWHPATIPTAVASSVSATPLVKHLVGLFGTCDAATKPMTKRLSAGKSCVLYIGGIAELFLASGSSETLYVKKRKGFIKLALRSGAEVVPVYFLGNTSVLSVVSNRMLRGFARRTGVTLTWFWGWCGTLLPRPNKILGVLGKPLGLPSTPIPEPTAEEIDHWHGRYMEEVRRIFDTYKKFNPDYTEKQLEFEPRQLAPEEGSDPDAAAGRAADEQLDQEITEKNAARKQAAADAAAESGKPAAVPMAPYESEFRGSTSEFELFEDITQPYWRRDTRLLRVDPWAVGEPESNPEIGGLRSLGNVQWFRGLKDDFRRKAPLYISDWTDGLRNPQKSLAAISFLYFACLAPVVAFGGAMAGLTQGAMGVAEVIASCGVCGMLYSMIAGQPMTFVAPTGLTLAFTAALYRYCASLAVPFLPMYSWVGCWTSLILIFASTINASGLIRYCTRFTEDVFNALLAFNFLAEATRSITSEFRSAATTSDGLLAANCAMLTAVLLQMVSGFRSKRYLSQQVRETISDFGPPMIIIGVSALTLLPAVQALGSFSRLSLPGGFMLSGGRALLVPMLTLPWNYRLLALLPAIFLATLFFLDQNITVRTVNSPSHKLAKGAAYHMDLCALGILTFLASITGLPWMCSATVQSLNHVRAMTRYSKSTNKDGRESESPSSVVETRLTGFGVHAGVLASALVIPALSCVPLPVVAGVFLYLGRKVMSGNQFLRRCKQLFLDKKELSVTTEGEKEQVILGRPTVFRFTALQVLCLAVLWALKLSPSTALIFPSVIGVLMLVRVQLIPKLFTARELMLLDTAIGATSA